MPDGATGAGPGPARTPRAVRVARWVLFGLLLLAAVLTLFALPDLQRAVAEGRTPPAALALPPAVLALFIVGYAAYRIALVRAGRYGAGKALVQVALMFLVFAIVAGVALRPGETALAPGHRAVGLARALGSTDPDVRALGAELARHRPREQALAVADSLAALVEDPAPEVRRQAHVSLVALAGSDVGGEGAGAAERWRAWARSAAAPAR